MASNPKLKINSYLNFESQNLRLEGGGWRVSIFGKPINNIDTLIFSKKSQACANTKAFVYDLCHRASWGSGV